MKVNGYAAHAATAPLAPYEFERREPRADDVVIDILYCGVCHTDLHLARNHFGATTYPIVPGHEIIGRVSAVGPDVKRFRLGDTVGGGCMKTPSKPRQWEGGIAAHTGHAGRVQEFFCSCSCALLAPGGRRC